MRVRVHRCGTDGKSGCRCKELIKEGDARARIQAGTAAPMPFTKTNGDVVPSDRAISMIKGRRFPPHAASIEEGHLERAYVTGHEGNYDQVRIHVYGQLTQEEIAMIGATNDDGVVCQKIQLRERQETSPATIVLKKTQLGE